jgi:hypothetical protein
MHSSLASTTRSIHISQGAFSHWHTACCTAIPCVDGLLWIWCALAAAGSNPHPADAKQQHQARALPLANEMRHAVSQCTGLVIAPGL